jgi:ABC-type dipeptide/oligopeptide/nickel transport system permease subunit
MDQRTWLPPQRVSEAGYLVEVVYDGSPADRAGVRGGNLSVAVQGEEYLLGGDSAGRDILSRLIASGRNTLGGAAIAVFVALVLGTTAGLLAGYFGRVFDSVASWVANAILALPAMIVLLALYQTLGGSMHLSMVVFGVMIAPGYFRLVRNQVISVKNEPYVEAAHVAGLSNLRIIVRHILQVIRSPIIIQTAIVAGIAIVIQSGLEFLGLGDPNLAVLVAVAAGEVALARHIQDESAQWDRSFLLCFCGDDGLRRVHRCRRRHRHLAGQHGIAQAFLTSRNRCCEEKLARMRSASIVVEI